MLNIMSYLGKSKSIKQLLSSHIDYLIDVDGLTPFDHCLVNKDFDVISTIFHHMEHEFWPLDWKVFKFAL